jgi:hypothetical protein
MALPQDIVPRPLIPFFQAGVMKQLLNIADEFGTGLSLFNAIRRAWPRDPGLDTQTYNQLIGWISTFVGRSLAAGDYIDSLAGSGSIDPSVIPKNFYLRRPAGVMCNYFVHATYQTRDTELGTKFDNEGYFFVDVPSDKKGLVTDVINRIESELEIIAATNNRDEIYQIVPKSISFKAAVRLC